LVFTVFIYALIWFWLIFLCQSWSAWAVRATINQLKCHHMLQAYHSVPKSYLKVLKIRLYRTAGWLKSCATQYVLPNFGICWNPMQLLQDHIYGNTVYFQIKNSGFSVASTQTQDMPLQYVFDKVSLKYSVSEWWMCAHSWTVLLFRIMCKHWYQILGRISEFTTCKLIVNLTTTNLLLWNNSVFGRKELSTHYC